MAPVETQGRGGLHFHMLVWLLQPVRARLLSKAGRDDAELKTRLRAWRSAVLEKVASVQHDSIEEPARQLGVAKHCVQPLPLNKAHQGKSRVHGALEKNDNEPECADAAGVEERPQGPKRREFEAKLQEPTPEDRAHSGRTADAPQTGSLVSSLPQWRRKPAYHVAANGQAVLAVAGGIKREAQRWKCVFVEDARRCVNTTKIHECRPTCWKRCYKSGGVIRQCRMGHQHYFRTAQYRNACKKFPYCGRYTCGHERLFCGANCPKRSKFDHSRSKPLPLVRLKSKVQPRSSHGDCPVRDCPSNRKCPHPARCQNLSKENIFQRQGHACASAEDSGGYRRQCLARGDP